MVYSVCFSSLEIQFLWAHLISPRNINRVYVEEESTVSVTCRNGSSLRIVSFTLGEGDYCIVGRQAPFVCQSPSRGKLTSMLFHSWKRELITGIYYLRSRPKSDPVQFVVNKVHLKGESVEACSRANPDCEACGA